MSGTRPAAARLSDRQRLNWLRLIRTENVGPATFRDLINRFGSAESALEFLPELALKGGAVGRPRIATVSEAEREMEACLKAGARLVAIGEVDYPEMLRRMDLPPPLVAVKGQVAALRLPAVGIVGARNASTAGVRMARLFAAEIGRAGYCVVSGLARGIDAAAHGASIDTGTIAVLAGGLDRPYPPENLDLCARIPERGCLISEMPFGWEPRARDFPRRNRLIAGLSLGLVVVEAARRSGSLITARLANEMGRLVFSVPGSPLDPRSEGTNGLLKEGAMLVTEASDVLEAIEPLVTAARKGSGITVPIHSDGGFEEPGDIGRTLPTGDADRDRVLEALSPTPTPVDEIIRHTDLHPPQVLAVLLELDLAGRLERHPGGSVSLAAIDP